MSGVHSILDPIEDKLADIGTTMDTASAEEVKFAVHQLISDPETTGAPAENYSFEIGKQKCASATAISA